MAEFYGGSLALQEGEVQHLKDKCVYMSETEKEHIVHVYPCCDPVFPLNPKGKRIRDKILAALLQQVEIDNKGIINWALSTKIQRDSKRGLPKSLRRRM